MLKINAPTQFFCFSQKLTYLNTAFSLTFVEERIGCSSEEYSEKEKKHLSRKKRKAAWNPEIGERNSTDLTDSPQKRERKNLENLAKNSFLVWFASVLYYKELPCSLGLDKALKWNFSNFRWFFLFCASVDVGCFLPRFRPGIPQPSLMVFPRNKGLLEAP